MLSKKRCSWCNPKNPLYVEYHDNEWWKVFTHDNIFYEIDKITNELSDAVSEDLKKRGMTFVGSVIIYSYLQAIGVIYSHEKECCLSKNKD